MRGVASLTDLSRPSMLADLFSLWLLTIDKMEIICVSKITKLVKTIHQKLKNILRLTNKRINFLNN